MITNKICYLLTPMLHLYWVINMTKKKTNSEFVKEVTELGKGEYVPLEKYSRSRDKILMKHKVCGTIYEVTPNNFIRGKRCPTCSKWTTPEGFVEKFYKHNNNPYVTLETPFYSYDIPIVVYCSKHNFRSTLMPTSILRGNYLCKYCSGEHSHKVQTKSLWEIIRDISRVHGNNISLIGDYYNTHTKTTFICNKCHEKFIAEPNSVISGSGCPKCSLSRGEQEISLYLDRHHICYKQQKSFKDCRDIRPLPFDFYLPKYNVLIEYDGIQHTKEIEYFGGADKFKTYKKHDKIKNEYARDNGIKLIRIPYQEHMTALDNLLDKLLTESNVEELRG